MKNEITILLVDDEPDALDVLSLYLGKKGYPVFTAADGQVAISILETRHCDIIISDIKMPRLDGLTLLGKVKDKYKNSEVILITGDGDLDGAREAIRNGAFDYLLKPVNLAEVIHRVEKAKEKILLERKLHEYTINLEKEKQRSENLLRQILPESIAEELKDKGKVQSVYYESASMIFTDFAGFTKISENMPPQKLVAELDKCFSHFDAIVKRFNIEKLKTIGDSYMCVGGVPIPNKTHARDACLAAFEMREFVRVVGSLWEEKGDEYWKIRIGVHTGPLVAGVIGKNKFSYDVWGDTVNTAARMESSGIIGEVNISRVTYELVKDYFDCESRGAIKAKNKGELEMFFLKGIKDEFMQ